MDTTIDLPEGSAAKALDLSNIRFQLIRLEDTITFHLIERVQFPLNATIYKAGGVRVPYSTLSLFDWFLREQEHLHSLIRRYQSPDEYPFFPDVLQKPILQPINYPRVLHPNEININDKIKDLYIHTILPAACAHSEREERGEKKENFGSSVTCDVPTLQALSRRIHFGKYVAEAKFRSETERFVKLIKAKDVKGLDDAITDTKVENKVLDRLALKAKTYGTDPDIAQIDPGKINDIVIPLTKEVEIAYLLQRLDGTEWDEKEAERVDDKSGPYVAHVGVP
ncbi:chorismate mutase [Aulographum hederae CBS 113979]|uniref:Chorismate mutase n=1 Tax=Aulographum hederae CBS 113979 TaxID=1176131 RepID=A0A6G1GW54_9PEZI|nr:chorismate mutase [Aulographum hederae CBS 113979]